MSGMQQVVLIQIYTGGALAKHHRGRYSPGESLYTAEGRNTGGRFNLHRGLLLNTGRIRYTPGTVAKDQRGRFSPGGVACAISSNSLMSRRVELFSHFLNCCTTQQMISVGPQLLTLRHKKNYYVQAIWQVMFANCLSVLWVCVGLCVCYDKCIGFCWPVSQQTQTV